MHTCETCPTNQWDAQRFYFAVVNEVRSSREINMHDRERVQSASDAVMYHMLLVLMPAGNA